MFSTGRYSPANPSTDRRFHWRMLPGIEFGTYLLKSTKGTGKASRNVNLFYAYRATVYSNTKINFVIDIHDMVCRSVIFC